MSSKSASAEDDVKAEKKELKNKVPADQLLPGFRHLDFQMYDGVMYSPHLWTKDMVTVLEKLREFPLRDDDVILFGFPRSGNNWTLEIINMILTQNIHYSHRHLMYHNILEYSGENIEEVFDKFPSPRCLCAQVHAKHLPKQVYEKKLKIVYLLRNPKDAITSQYTMTKLMDQTKIKMFNGEFDEFLQATLENKATLNSWFDHVLAMERYQEEHPEVPVYVSLFEDKKLRPVEAIRSLCAFLGKPDTMAEEIAEAMALAMMKEQTMKKSGYMNASAVKEGNQGFLQQGDVGDWKHQFSEAQSEAFDKVFEERMGKSRLASFVREYL